ncbi:MAG: hypothetical protein NC397_01035 [Clostridium sp.]|nr:hypothetical protein [Clostridium sp.]
MFKHIGSRNILCFFLSLIIAAGASLFVGSVLVNIVCSNGYMSLFFNASDVNEYCDKVYSDRIAVLADNSNIPVNVFERAEGMVNNNENAVDRFFSNSDTSLYLNERIQAYEELCKEYLVGNEIKFDEAAVHNTAVKAAEIYAESYGIQNADALKDFVSSINEDAAKVSSNGLVMILAATLVILFLFNDKKKSLRYFSSAITAAGITCIIVGLAGKFIILKNVEIAPVVYGTALDKAIGVMCFLFILVGVVMTALSVYESYRLIVKKSAYRRSKK